MEGRCVCQFHHARTARTGEGIVENALPFAVSKRVVTWWASNAILHAYSRQKLKNLLICNLSGEIRVFIGRRGHLTDNK